MLGKKCFRKINKIGNHLIIGSSPIGSKLKTVAGLFRFLLPVLMLFDSAEPGSIGIILGMSAIGNHKDLYILVQTGTRPEAVALIPVNLIEGFFQRHTPAFQFHMNQRQTVHQYGNIVPVIIIAAFLRVLIQYLQIIVMNVFLINQRNVLG